MSPRRKSASALMGSPEVFLPLVIDPSKVKLPFTSRGRIQIVELILSELKSELEQVIPERLAVADIGLVIVVDLSTLGIAVGAELRESADVDLRSGLAVGGSDTERALEH